MTDKQYQHDWEIENEDEIIDRFLDDYEDRIKEGIKMYIKDSMRRPFVYLENRINILYNESKAAQYEQYLDTPEFDHMKEGRGER